MILTYKVKHHTDLTDELRKALLIAKYAINNRDKLSTKYIAHIGLKSAIANQILRKYGRNKKIKRVSRVKLTVPSQSIEVNDSELNIVPLKLKVVLDKAFQKINQIELDEQYAYISATVKENQPIATSKHVGVDLNATGHCVVLAVKETGKVYKFGKEAYHIHEKYKCIRRLFQAKGKFYILKRIKNREFRVVKDLNHKIAKKIVDIALENQASIQLEDLKGIRQTKKKRKSFNHTLNSWSFYQMKTFIEYKAQLAGVPVNYIEPAYTSKCCSRCGQIGQRSGKNFKCPCGYVEHADVNAAFNIALVSNSIVRLQAERDVCKGNTDTPKRLCS